MSLHTVITGCNRGIGLEFVEQYLTAGWRVSACVRDTKDAAELEQLVERFPTQLRLFSLDLTRDESIEALKRALADQPIDLLINNAGVYGPKSLQLGNVDRETWLEVLNVNTVAPLLLVQALLPNVLAGQLKKIAILSSKVGSISDNGSGAGYMYRSSKTAVNQVVKSLSIDLASQQVTVLALHPGWVKTRMGGPNALIDCEESVRGLRNVIESATLAQSGSFTAFDGQNIDW